MIDIIMTIITMIIATICSMGEPLLCDITMWYITYWEDLIGTPWGELGMHLQFVRPFF